MLRSQRTLRKAGFTLIEVLIVVAIVAVLAGMVGTSFVGSGQTQAMQGFAYRMAQRVELARDRALQRNREWGLYLEADAYEFAEFNETTQMWEPYTLRPFNTEAYTAQVEMSAEIEEYQGQVETEEELLPDLILFSSGEVTPFKITMKHIAIPELIWVLESDGFTRTTAFREND